MVSLPLASKLRATAWLAFIVAAAIVMLPLLAAVRRRVVWLASATPVAEMSTASLRAPLLAAAMALAVSLML